VGILVVPSDKLAVFLTDHAPSFSAATQAVERALALELPILVIGLEHDGVGVGLVKQPKAPSGSAKRGKPQLSPDLPKSPVSGDSRDRLPSTAR
jgi:hypothetical protein